jgi:NAD(P)-dependent dehydrogenase (short-subunit alcohol dehydrogenase family)
VSLASHGRHILVTGAASGIGEAICDRFARDGALVTAVDLRGDALLRVCDRLSAAAGTRVSAIVGDLAEDTFAEGVIQSAWDQHGPIDILVAAAGIYPAIPFRELTAATWDRVQAINVRSVMQLIRSFANLAIAAHRPGCIVTISSGAALRARPGAAHYSASKAALEMLTKSAAIELGEFGIRVNAVSPGFVDVDSSVNPVTEGYAAAVSVNPLGRRGRPSDIAAAVFWLAGDDAAWVNGTILRVDGGASAGTTALPLHWSEPTLHQVRGANEGN